MLKSEWHENGWLRQAMATAMLCVAATAMTACGEDTPDPAVVAEAEAERLRKLSYSDPAAYLAELKAKDETLWLKEARQFDRQAYLSAIEEDVMLWTTELRDLDRERFAAERETVLARRDVIVEARLAKLEKSIAKVPDRLADAKISLLGKLLDLDPDNAEALAQLNAFSRLPTEPEDVCTDVRSYDSVELAMAAIRAKLIHAVLVNFEATDDPTHKATGDCKYYVEGRVEYRLDDWGLENQKYRVQLGDTPQGFVILQAAFDNAPF